ncbi:hypothetical protein EZY14_017120 [Kordia sp. TARA_039_SRF]|nr:hypothetical protein EZY14_017120 [Kordia sp. TARA_039_SRF]
MKRENIYNLVELLVIGSVTTIGFLMGKQVGGTIMQGLGINLASNILDKGNSKLKSKWLESRDGILNHDIQRALLRAFSQAMVNIEKEYINQEYIKGLSGDYKEAIRLFFKTVNDTMKINFRPILMELLDENQIQVYLSKKPQLAESELWLKMKLDSAFEDCTKPVLNYYDNYEYDIKHLKDYLQQNLHYRIKYWFSEELKKDSKETNKAWRAFQRLLLEGIKEDIYSVKMNQTENLEKLLNVEGLILSLKDTIDKRLSKEPFLLELENVLSSNFKRVSQNSEIIIKKQDEHIELTEEIFKIVKKRQYGQDRVLTNKSVKELLITDILKELPLTYVKGLTDYEIKDANSYYGRDGEINLLVERIIKNSDPFLLLSGPSGVGKSSFLKAGILPRLQQKNWPCLVMRPTSNPFVEFVRTLIKSENFYMDAVDKKPERLAYRYAKQYSETPELFSKDILRSLHNRNKDSKVVLAVDQFEELLVDNILSEDKDNESKQMSVMQSEAYKFIQALIHLVDSAPERVVIIITIREDSRSVLWEQPWVKIANKFNGFQYDIYEPSRNDLRKIIITSANEAKFRISNNLVTRLISDLEIGKLGYSSALPILSLALEEVGISWAKEALKKEAYEKQFKLKHYPSGLGTILETKIKQVIRDLHPEEREALPRLFMRFVSVNSMGRAIRTQVNRTAILGDDVLLVLIDVLINYRLIVEHDQTCELVHDIIINAWSELKIWFQKHKDQLFEIKELYSKALFWKEQGYSQSRLMAKDRFPRIDLMRKASVKFSEIYNSSETELINTYINASRKQVLIGIIQNDDLDEALEILNVKESIPSGKIDEDELLILEKSYYAMFPNEIDLDQLDIISSNIEEVSEILGGNQTLLDRRLKYFNISDIEKTKKVSHTGLNLAHYAAIAGQIPVLKRLNTIGVNLLAPHLKNNKGTSPWLAAVSAGQISTVEWFIKLAQEVGGEMQIRKLINEQNNDKNNALIWAAYQSSSKLLQILVEWSDDLNGLNEFGWAALHYSTKNDAINKTNILVNAGANIALTTKLGENIIHLAIHQDDNKYLEHVLKLNARIIKENEFAKKEIKNDELLLNNTDNSLQIKQVIDINQPNRDGLSAFLIASSLGNIKAAQLLYKYDVNLNQKGQNYKETAIMLAANQGKLKMLDWLSEKQLDFNAVDKNNNNALHWALRGEADLDIVEYLLSKHVDIEQTNNKEETPTHIAIRHSKNTSAKLLISKLDVANQTKLLESILKLSKQEQNSELILFILEKMPEEPLPFMIQSFDLGKSRKLKQLSPEKLKARFKRELELDDDGNWKIPFLLQDGWTNVARGQASNILKQVFELLPIEFGVGIDRFDKLLSRPLSFMDDSRLFTARAKSKHGIILGYLQFIQHGVKYTILDGKSSMIHKMCKEQQIQLDEELKALEYLKLFCSAVHGDSGAFRILESKEEIQEDLKRLTPLEVQQILKPPVGEKLSDSFKFVAPVKYGSTCFMATFIVTSSGSVNMIEDRPIQIKLDSPSLIFKGGILRLENKMVESKSPDSEEVYQDEEEKNFDQKRSILWESKSLLGTTSGRRLVGDKLKLKIKEDITSIKNSIWTQELPGIGTYKMCDSKESLDVLLALSTVLPVNLDLNIDRIESVRSVELICYQNSCKLYQAHAVFQGNHVGDFLFVYGESECIVLDGSLNSLSMVNNHFLTQLDTKKKLLQYAHIYFSAIQAKGSVFKIIDNNDSLNWHINTEIRTKKTFSRLIHSPIVNFTNSVKKDTIWELDAIVQHGQKLSRILFTIDSIGNISGKDEIVLMYNLPLCFLQYIDSCLVKKINQ